MKNIILISIIFIAGCQHDENDRPTYGESGLPKNCRAYVQFAIDEYRARKYTADDTLTGLERNCGTAGHLWGNNK